MSQHRFQINLRGIIELLSNHLYSGPQVYLRELLQNGVDAIRARQHLHPEHAGQIEMEVIGGDPPTLHFADDGIGLTQDEIHAFLATIGETSKGGDLLARRSDFLGQFGIGLLSCFLVSDEIVVITRSAREGTETIEWRGRPDGTYAIKVLEREIAPGTQVFLRAKRGFEEWLSRDRVEELTRHFGSLLPHPIRLTEGGHSEVVNDRPPPWRNGPADPEATRAALLEFGREVFHTEFFDAIPLQAAGGIEGVAYVLPFRPSLATQGTHRIYLKNMLVSESAKNLVPEWAFFVKCLINTEDLRPNASREALYEDAALEAARQALGEELRAYLVRLSQGDRDRWRAFLVLHTLSIKALALQDEELYRLFIDWLPFETSMGELTLAQAREIFGDLRYVPKVDQFRQIAQVAAAQSLCVINAGYTYDVELLERYREHFPERGAVSAVDPNDLAQSFEEISLDEREEVFEFIAVADDVLRPYRCRADVKRFQPQELPTLYTTDADAGFRRSIEQSREISGELWSSVLGDLDQGPPTYAQLCFNFANPLVRKVVAQPEPDLVRRCVQMLYVQALLLGHHPLSEREMAVLNEGLLGLIDWGLQRGAGR